MKAVLLMGGKGTRLKELGEHIPKHLLDINGLTLAEHQINCFKKSGIKEFYFSVSKHPLRKESKNEKNQQIPISELPKNELTNVYEKMKVYFGDGSKFGVNIKYIVEEEPLGTAGWMKLIPKPKEDIFVCNGDDLLEISHNELLKFHKKLKRERGILMTNVLSEVEDPRMFGVVILENDRIKEFKEKPKTIEEDPSKLVSVGHYIISPEVWDILPIEKKMMIEYDISPKLAKMNKLGGFVLKGKWCTTNSQEQLEETRREWKR